MKLVTAQVIEHVPDEIPVLLDVKRGDIGSTSEAYARAAYDALGADCVTISPYMGRDSVTPFVRPGKGVFLLCKTSNPSSNDVQTLRVAGSAYPTVFEHVAGHAAQWAGAGEAAPVGLVVGATDSDALRKARAAAPSAWILAPGVGAQGGSLEDVMSLAGVISSSGCTANTEQAAPGRALSKVLIPVSRGITSVSDGDYASAAARLVSQMREAAGAIIAGPAAQTPTGSELLTHQQQFLQLAIDCSVLKFGSFTLKSGRQSPYFFNAGLFRSGAALATLGHVYAQAILHSKQLTNADGTFNFDVLFGPAYKGIPLVTATGMALAMLGHDLPVAYNRKEAKDHGEGGTLVGACVQGKRVLVLDDVMSAGTAVRACVAELVAAGASPAGVLIGLDRQEVGQGSSGTATQEVARTMHIPVVSVVSLQHLLEFVRSQPEGGAAAAEGGDNEALLKQITEYQAQYCITE